jgi:hypothetical protein
MRSSGEGRLRDEPQLWFSTNVPKQVEVLNRNLFHKSVLPEANHVSFSLTE